MSISNNQWLPPIESLRSAASKTLEAYNQVLDLGYQISLETFCELNLGPTITKERVEIHHRRLLLKKHRQQHLARTCVRRYPGSTYDYGSEVWQRQDQKPLTEKDIEAIRDISYGQVNPVLTSLDGNYATLSWERDSSD